MHVTRRFRNRQYAVMLAYDGSRPIHRTCVFPGYFRFPFMEPRDLQIGDVWTDPDYRGQGIAGMGLARALTQLASTGPRRVWYLTESTNTASIRLAERIGFTSVGQGSRTKKFHCRALGAYVINELSTNLPQTRMDSYEKAA
ncbi:GNAT family N-acetyltransferase [Roseimaritima ulvae]